jgi:hypothetical protein
MMTTTSTSTRGALTSFLFLGVSLVWRFFRVSVAQIARSGHRQDTSNDGSVQGLRPLTAIEKST